VRPLDLGAHQRDDVGRIGLGVAGLVPRPQVDEDVLVRKDHPELVGTDRPEGGHDAGHPDRLSTP
jgi:hypothetical protein